MTVLAVAAVIALANVQNDWPPTSGYVSDTSARTAPLKSEAMDVPDPNDPKKTVRAVVYTTVGWYYDSIVEHPPVETKIVARTVRLTSDHQSEEVELLSEGSMRGKDGIALGLHFALTDLGIDPAVHMQAIMDRLTEWDNLPEASGKIQPTKFTVTWNPHANDNPKAIVEHDVGYVEYEYKMVFTIERRYKIGDKIYGLLQHHIQNETVRVGKQAKNTPLATRVIIPEDKAAEDNRTGFFSCPGQEDKLAGISYAGGWAAALQWPGGDVGSSDLKIGGLKLGDYWGGFAGGSSAGAVFTGDGMNRIGFNPGAISAGLGSIAMPDEMFFPGGTLFVPDDPAYQIVMAGQNFCFRRDTNPLFATTTPQLPPNQGYTLCAQMNKLEPTRKVNYFPVSPPNSIFTTLAKMSDQAILKGPAEQARLWIYTNRASFSQINTKLFPGIMARQYVNCLYDVANMGGLVEADMANPKLFEPRLLAASGLNPKVSGWFCSNLIERWPKEVRAELSNPGMELKNLVKVGAKPDDLKSAALMTAFLLESGNQDVRMGALGYLMSVPSENAAAMAAHSPLREGMTRAFANPEELKLLDAAKAKFATQP